MEAIAQADAEEKRQSAQSQGLVPDGYVVPDAVIGRALTSGGNNEHSIEHIVAFFQKTAHGTAPASFMEKEFGEGGKGVTIANQDYAVWFSKEGFRIAPGLSAFGPGSTLISWEKAAVMTASLLRDGMFAAQDRIDAAHDTEIRELSAQLWRLYHDLSDSARAQNFLPTISLHFAGKDFRKATQEIAALLETPVHRQQIMREMAGLASEYRNDPDLLLFQKFHNLWELYEGIYNLFGPHEQFRAVENFAPAAETFITEDEIDHLIAGGPNISGSKLQIYSYFVQGHDAKECADFLKNSYGDGGRGYLGYDEWHDSKGIRLSRGDDFSEGDYDKVTLNWNQVQKRIQSMIETGQYLNEQEKSFLPQYEKVQLARKIYAFQYYNPNDPNRTYPHEWDFETAQRNILPLLNDPEKSAALYEDMVRTMAAVSPDNGAYAQMESALRDMGAFVRGEYSLFTPLPEAVLQAERQQRQAAKERKKEQRVQKGNSSQEAIRETSSTPDAPGDRLAAAARALAKKRQAAAQEDQDGQFSLFNVPSAAEESEPEPPAPPPNQDTADYDLMYAHLGNGVTVWNTLQEDEDDGYKRMAAITISLQGPRRSRQTYFFMPMGGEKGMACYTSRTYEERRTIQKLWEAGAKATEIADKLDAPVRSIYAELRRGQDGSRLENKRLSYNADLAQLRIQQSFERRGRKAGDNPDQKGASGA